MFESINQHIKKHSQHSGYIGRLLSGFYTAFLQKIEEDSKRSSSSLGNRYLQEHFPEEWKITIENMNNKESMLWVYTRNRIVIEWMFGRIYQNNKEQRDNALDEVAHIIFPYVNLIEVGYVLLCLAYPSSLNNGFDFKQVIEHPHNFLQYSFHDTGRTAHRRNEGETEEEFQKRIDEDYKRGKEATQQYTTALIVEFSKDIDSFASQAKLPKYIEELEGLKQQYQEDSIKMERIEVLITIFKEMLIYIEKKGS